MIHLLKLLLQKRVMRARFKLTDIKKETDSLLYIISEVDVFNEALVDYYDTQIYKLCRREEKLTKFIERWEM